MERIMIVTGHYGSGKTEFAVNLCLYLARDRKPMTLVDLDIVNPYFRAVERRPLLEASGVSVLASSCGGLLDLPAIPPELLTVWESPDVRAVVDVGGDAIGAHVLARFAPYLDTAAHDLLFVINANRPETNTVDAAIAYMHSIEDSCKQRVTGLVNNTHLCGETSLSDLVRGASLVCEVSERTGVPVLWHAVEDKFCDVFSADGLGEVLPIRISMTKPWEKLQEDV